MKSRKFVKRFLAQKSSDLGKKYGLRNLSINFDNSMRVGEGNASYLIKGDKYGCYVGGIQLGEKNLSFAGCVTDLHFTMALVALHHEFHHVKQFQNMRHNCNPYYGLMLNSMMATSLCANNNRSDYYYENYRNNTSEIDAIYGSLQDAYMDLSELNGETTAEQMLLDFVNRQGGLKTWPLEKTDYQSLDLVLTDLEEKLRDSLTHVKSISRNDLQSAMLQRFVKAQPATKSVLYDLNQGYRGDMQDMYLAACYCDSMGDKGFMSPTNGHQSIFFNIHDMNFDSQICGRAWQQARNYERHPLDMDLVWDHRFEDMDEERYEQIFGHPPNMVPKSRPVPEIRGMEDMPSHDFSLGS